MRRAKQKARWLSPGLSIPASKTVVSKQDCVAKLLVAKLLVAKFLAASFSAAGRYFAAVLLMVFSNGL